MGIELLKANWGVLVQAIIAIFGVIIMYWIYHKVKSEKKVKEEEEFKADVRERLAKLEKATDMLTTLYPQLKSLEKLENFEKLTEEDIRRIVSEVLKATNITPEAIDVRIEEKIEKKYSDFDKGIASIVAQRLNEIDERFKKPIGNASDYLILGNVEYAEGNYLKAIERYEKALKLKPDYAEAWYNKGVTLGKLGQYNEALEAFNKAIEIKPDFAEGWCNKGVALGELGRYDEALKSFDKAIDIEPKFAETWYNKATIYLLKGDKENALGDLSKAIELDAKYKEEAEKDKDFKNLWDDEDFKKILS